MDGEEETIRDIIHLGSTSVTEVQAPYLPVELECLAAQWACEKCHYFLADAPKINLFTDSSGLVGLWKKDLSEIKNSRIQRILEKMVCYNIEAFHIPAKENGIADYFSRFPETSQCLAQSYPIGHPSFCQGLEGEVGLGKN